MPKANSNKKTKVAKAPKVNQKTLTDWIYKTYDVDQLPKHFFMHIASIKKGKYKGQRQPISVADLLDMWQRSMPKLEKIYAQNCSRGKVMEGYARISYDLSIVMSRYSSYLAWKLEQEAKRKEEESKADRIDYTKAYEQIEENRQINNDTPSQHKVLYKSGIEDISEVLDEMWVSDD